MARGGYRENAGRKANWNSSETQTIRVPKIIASKLLEIAKRLDNGEAIDFDTKSNNSIQTSKDELEKIGQIVLTDLSVTRNGKDSDSVRRAVKAMIKLLNE